MKTRIRTLVGCGNENSGPCVRTNIEIEGKRAVHLGCIAISRYEGDNQANLSMLFLEERRPIAGSDLRHYLPILHTNGTDPVAERICRYKAELGLTWLYEHEDHLEFIFKIGRKQFCQQSIELVFKLNDILGVTDLRWMDRIGISQETEVWHKGGWQSYARYLVALNRVD